MNQIKRGLGANLSALGLKELVSNINASIDNAKSAKAGLKNMPIEALRPGRYQPRKTMDQEFLIELADSIRVQGVIQPIILRPLSADQYEIIAGERRWRAAQMAGLKEVPVIVRELTDKEAVAISLIENVQRQNLNAIEEAEALDRLMREFTMTHEELAIAIGKSRVTVTNILRLLNLHKEVKNLLSAHKLEMGHARALLALPELKQIELAKIIANKRLSVREAEKLVNKVLGGKVKLAALTKIDPNISRLQNELSEKIGAKIAIKCKGKTKGQIIILYHSLDELDGILRHIK